MKRIKSYGTFEPPTDDIELKKYHGKDSKDSTEVIFKSLKRLLESVTKHKQKLDSVPNDVADADKHQFNTNLDLYLKFLDNVQAAIKMAEVQQNISTNDQKELDKARELYAEYNKYKQMRKY